MSFGKKIKRKIQSNYNNDLVNSFLRPTLKEAKLYQRVSGYFTTAGIDLYTDGLEELAKNNGEVQYIISKTISKDDYQKIKQGYNLLEEVKPLNIAERNDKLNSETQAQLGNLAFLIANGRARVKVALTDEGIFHDKFGIISSEKDKIFFTGSANETYSGINKNYESISVDVSWDSSQKVIHRINSYTNRFNRLWHNEEPKVTVIEASELAYEEIAKYQSQSLIPPNQIEKNNNEIKDKDNCISFQLINNSIIRADNTEDKITHKDRKLRQGSDISFFFEADNSVIKPTTTYKDIERIIKVTKRRAKRKNIEVIVSDAVHQYIIRNKYSIEQYRIIGDVFKNEVKEFPLNKQKLYSEFSNIVQSEVSRPLYELHLRAAYYEYEMNRSANFSVPGAGKTAMILGVFAYLNREKAKENEQIDRMLVVSPISAFDSWKREFKAVFGTKKILRTISPHDSSDFKDDLNLKWGVSNLILINYESLPSYSNQLQDLIDSRTMLIFDEVHRIKNPHGIRAQAALDIVKIPRFKYILTGTPIPNSYEDIYNYLHILYGNEYNSFFGWDLDVLKNPTIRRIDEINRKIHPFFWRTNKQDLMVPPPDSDIIKSMEPSKQQMDLAETIFENEKSSLARLIRLIQASTNPSLIKQSIDYNELMSFDENGDVKGISGREFNMLLGEKPSIDTNSAYNELDLDNIVSPKFVEGIDLVTSLVKEGKKVLVWGIFVDTIKKITHTLRDKGVRVNLVYGGTEKSERVKLIDEFRDEDVQVLVTNPQTLSESISLHQTVHDAVYFEYDFNLTFMLQSRDRIHRLGLESNQSTRYYYLQTKGEDASSFRPGYIDEKIYERLKDKEEIMYNAIDDDTLSIEYSENEILDAIKIIDEENERIRSALRKI